MNLDPLFDQASPPAAVTAITIRRPDDWHIHLHDGAMLRAVLPYVQVFDEEGALDRFEAFASLNGARFHGLEPNAGTLMLERQPSRTPSAVTVGDSEVVVFRGDEMLPWSIAEVRS